MSFHLGRSKLVNRRLGRVSAGYALSQAFLEEEPDAEDGLRDGFDGYDTDDEGSSLSSPQALIKLKVQPRPSSEAQQDKITAAAGGQLLFARETLECVLDVSRKLAQDPETQVKIMAALDESWEIVDVPGGMTVPVFPAPEEHQYRRKIQNLSDDSDSSVFDTDLSDSDIDRICIVPGNLELEDSDGEGEEEKDPNAPENRDEHAVDGSEGVPRSPRNLRPGATLMSKAAEWMQTALRALLRTIRDNNLVSSKKQDNADVSGEQEALSIRRRRRGHAAALIPAVDSRQEGRTHRRQRRRRRQIPRHIVQSSEFTVAALAGAVMILLWVKQRSAAPSRNQQNVQ